MDDDPDKSLPVADGVPDTSQATLEEVEVILSRVARLRSASPGRRLATRTALSLLGKPPVESVQPLVSTLHNASVSLWREREIAAWTLGRAPLSPHDRDAVSASLLGVLENAYRESGWTRAARAVMRNVAVGMIFAVFGFGIFDGGAPFLGAVTMINVMIAPIVFPLSLAYDRHLNDHVRAAAAIAVGRLSVPEAVGPLAAALFDRSASVRSAAELALHQVLPALKEEHYGRLGAESMAAVGKCLSHPDAMLVFKMLDALKVVGTGSAVPFVEKLAHSGRTMKLRDTAAEVLTVLRDRQRRENDSERLLRSTNSPTDSSGMLLRPARDTSEGDSQQLLRASLPDDQSDALRN